MLVAIIGISTAMFFRKKSILKDKADDKSAPQSDDLTMRARFVTRLGIVGFVFGPVWGFGALEFVNVSTVRGELLTLGVAAISFVVGVICFIYGGVLATLAWKKSQHD